MWWKKFFQKKFKTRVVHFGQDKYSVEFSYYLIIPLWHALDFWFSQTLTGGTECWSTQLFSFSKAEEFAASLKSKEDLDNYYKEEKKKETLFYKEKKEYLDKNVPYQKKVIK
jgi:hypothetical protein